MKFEDKLLCRKAHKFSAYPRSPSSSRLRLDCHAMHVYAYTLQTQHFLLVILLTMSNEYHNVIKFFCNEGITPAQNNSAWMVYMGSPFPHSPL